MLYRYRLTTMQLALLIGLSIAIVVQSSDVCAQTPPTKVHRYARFQIDGTVAYGLVEGDQIRQIDGDLLGEWKPGTKAYPLAAR